MELEDEEQGEEQQPRRPEPQQEPRLNGKVLYDIAGGTPHGHFAIGNGAVRAADVRAAAKKNRLHPSNSVSMQSMAREMARLRHANESLQRDNRAKDIATYLILGLYQDLGKEIPDHLQRRLSAAHAIATSSSHVGSESPNNMDVNGHNGEDLGGTNIDNTHGSNQHCGNNALSDDAT